MKIAPIVLALLMGTATAVQAQQSTSPGVTQPPASTTRTDKGPVREAHGSWSAKDFVNSAVYNTAGDRIGDIRDVIVDDGGRVASKVIGVGGFLGMGEKDVSHPIS
jgi:hypothetical protein